MKERSCLIELVGIAGAGKTTLERILCQSNSGFQVVVPPQKTKYIKFVINHACRWFPVYLRRCQHSRWFTCKEIKLMGYLEIWPAYVTAYALDRSKVTVLNPGPIYWLTALRKSGPQITASQRFETWWTGRLSHWATLVKALVWLDAPNMVLLERIHSRDDWHELKEMPDQEALECIKRFRTGYEQVVSAMTVNSSPVVLSFRTDQVSPDQIAEAVLAVLD